MGAQEEGGRRSWSIPGPHPKAHAHTPLGRLNNAAVCSAQQTALLAPTPPAAPNDALLGTVCVSHSRLHHSVTLQAWLTEELVVHPAFLHTNHHRHNTQPYYVRTLLSHPPHPVFNACATWRYQHHPQVDLTPCKPCPMSTGPSVRDCMHGCYRILGGLLKSTTKESLSGMLINNLASSSHALIHTLRCEYHTSMQPRAVIIKPPQWYAVQAMPAPSHHTCSTSR